MSWSRRKLLASAAALMAPRLAPAANGAALVRRVSGAYGRAPGEDGEFDDAYALFTMLLPKEARKPVDPANDPVPVAVRDLARLISSRGAAALDSPALFNHPPGRIVERPLRGARYVVFSDHHLNTYRHRHNVFSGRGGSHFASSNLDLYTAVLDQYNSGGFTLVENGDVEDLVVFDPALHPGEFRHRLDLCRDCGAAGALDALVEHRVTFRRHLLQAVLADPRNARYYERLSAFDVDGRLVRVAGNHDYQVRTGWEQAVEDATREGRSRGEWPIYPDAACFADVLALTDGDRWGGVVLHGHQFDHASSPLRAGRHGETISECLGVWFQGADRVWSWRTHCREWAAGRPFRNLLVSGSVPTTRELREVARPDGQYAYPHWLEARQRLEQRSPLDAAMWEMAFEHPIAWDYFAPDPDRPSDAVADVYETLILGDAWFKYRHTEELELCDTLPGHLEGEPPLVVLGHTHEPRLEAIDQAGNPVPWYLNTAASGRFEGLLWGVEIVDGEPLVVSWHADPYPSGVPVRQVWRPGGRWRHLLVPKVETLP